jgi:NAD(P)-dependent dehydrogenase (short-subunit alcohol dehydrogenase family)
LAGARRSPTREKGARLPGKVAVVTGGNQGIGLAIARALVAEGCHLIITGRNQVTLARARKELARPGISVLALGCDVRNPREVKALAATIRKRFGQLHILINNAGISHRNLVVEKLPFPVWRDLMATNLDGMFLVTQAALPLMPRGGAIVNNLSIAARRVFAGASAYNASKHGALGFTSTLREELRPKGIRVIALLAGATDTAIWNTFWPDAPRKKMMKPETVAASVVNALALPADGTVEEITLLPAEGTL